MNLAIIGRTSILVASARQLHSQGHNITLVVTPNADEEFERLARDCGAEFCVTTNINSDDQSHKLSRCDLGVSLNWITLIKPEILSCVRYGVLNAHAGDLPRYRGNACPNWAILREEEKMGLCIHQMVGELDAGPVFVREFLPLTSETYIGEVYEWIAARVPEMFAEAIDMIECGAAPIPQSTQRGLRCYPRRPADSRIDWRQSAHTIRRLVRASSYPFDGAFCFDEDGRKIVVWKADVIDPVDEYVAMPGQPCSPIDGDPVIACGDGFLRLLEVSIEKALINKSLRKRLL